MFGLEKKKKKDIDILDAYKLIEENKSNQKFTILDVRTPEEFQENRIENAKNIDYYSNNFKDQILKLEMDGMYLVYCRSGGRSSSAVNLMEKLGFEDVKNLSGGIMKWNKKGLPLKGQK